MGDTIVDVDDIKDQLNLVVNELRSFVARLEDMKASNRGLYCGFDRFFELTDRQKSIAERLKPGKAPSKQTVFLLLCIIDAMKNGPISEKEIKEHIMEKCRIYDIKSTNRGTVAGSNIEVSAACHILSSVGIIESFSENHKEKKGGKSSCSSASSVVPDYGSCRDKYLAEKLLEILSARWGVSLSQPPDIPKREPPADPSTQIVHGSEAHQPYFVQASSTANDFVQPLPMIATNDTNHQYAMSEEMMDDNDMDFVDILLERSESLMHPEHDFHHDFGFNNPHATKSPSIQHSGTPNLSHHNDNSTLSETLPPMEVFEAGDRSVGAAEGQLPFPSSDSTGLADSSHFDHIPTDELLGGDALEDEEDGESDEQPDYGEDNDDDDESDDQQEPTILSYDVNENDDNLMYQEANIKQENEVQDFLGSHITAQSSSSQGNVVVGLQAIPKQNASRKSHSTSRIWRLKESFLLVDSDSENNPLSTVMINPLLSQPEVVLEKWNEVNYELQACLEIEEKMLRKLLSQCYDCNTSHHSPVAKILATNRSYQLGTKYLDSRFDGESSTERSFEMPYHQHNPSQGMYGNEEYNGGQFASSSGSYSQIPNTQRKDLFDENITLTGLDLIEKVRRNRRQRGSCLSSSGSVSSTSNPSNQLHSNTNGVHVHYLNNLKTVCLKAQQSFWEPSSGEVLRNQEDEAYLEGSEDVPSSSTQYSIKSRKSLVNSVVSNINANQLTLFELLKQMIGQNNIAVVNNSLVNTILTNYSQNMMVNGCFPNITLSTLRHYSFPVNNYCADPIINASLPVFPDQGIIQLTDLLITTLEIPWKSLIPEFVVVKGDDVMGIPSGSSNSQSYSNQDKEENDMDGSVEMHGSPQFSRRRSLSRSFNQFEQISSYGSLQNSSESIRNVMKCQIVADVPAPTFNEIEDCTFTPAKDIGSNSTSSDDEDTSDEAYLQNHDSVLRNMREKWAIMQQLKVQTRRDSFSFPSTSFPIGGGNRKSINGQMLDSLRSPDHASYMSQFSSMPFDDGSGRNLLNGHNSKRNYHDMSHESGNDYVNLQQTIQPVKKRGRPPKLQKLNHMHYGRVTS